MNRRPGAALLVLALTACAEELPERTARPPLSACLVTLDTTRRDALGAFGGRPRVTPRLDALAEESVRYDVARTVAPLTLPSHSSILTGLYPPRHGVRTNGARPLSEAAVTVAELAHEAGHATAAFVAAVVLDPVFGLDQGFDVYDAPARPDGGSSSHYLSRPGSEVVDAALVWLAERDRARPFFLWVHLFDPHQPYEPPPEFSSVVPSQPYLGEVAAADAAVGRLVDALRGDGALDDTLLVVVADHGEAFGEHDESTHGSYCYDTTIRVPLLVRHPDGYRAGERSGEIASVVDVAPTLAAALGRPFASGIDGVSLFDGRVPDGRGVYFESYDGYLAYGWSPLAGWADARGKYLHSSAPELYDTASDAGERTNLFADERDVERYRRAIGAVVAAPSLAAGGAGVSELGPELQALGYAGAGLGDEELPDPLAPTDRPAPAQRAGEQADCMLALELLEGGLRSEAERLLERVLAANPRNRFARDRMATVHLAEGRAEAARALLESLAAEDVPWAGTWFNLGLARALTGARESAGAAFRRAVELDPREPRFLEELARWYESEGDAAEAARHRARREALRAENPGQESDGS